jgi:hypothetical protein
MIKHRPCAVCAALVPSATGCKHWRGDGAPVPAKSTASAAHKRARDQVRQQENRDAEKYAKDRARAAVDKFRAERQT